MAYFFLSEIMNNSNNLKILLNKESGWNFEKEFEDNIY